ncbi:MAG: Ig domain protein group 2 domain protein [Gemmatimonadetes bacterium]|nr:Ig domain protein group 2 domain protein [Gemmatimonadota bacterium]
MHKVSRSLLLAGVLAFGTLTAACGDKVVVQGPTTPTVGVTSITVTPTSATIGTGAANAITLAVAVVSDATTAKTVAWTSSNAGVATVDATGKVTGVTAGTVTITATSTADATKAAAAVITVTGGAQNTPNTVAIATVNQTAANGTVAPANLANVAGQLDVTLFVSGPSGTLNLIQNCSANAATSTVGDVIVAQQVVAGSQNQTPVTLSYNTAATGAITNGIAVPNATSTTPIQLNSGSCVLKAQLGTATATNVTPLTLNNASRYNVAMTTSGPSAISGVNGLNYQSGDVVLTIVPVNYVSNTPLATISGTFAGRTFNQVAPTAGTQSFVITFPSAIIAQGTAGGVPALSISNYTSPAAGDNLIITSSVTTGGANGFVVAPTVANPLGASLTTVRIDNSAPVPAAVQVAQVATNGTSFINASYAFATGANFTANPDSGAAAGTGTNTVVTTFGYAPSASVASLTGNTLYGVAAGQGIGPVQCSQTGFTIAANASAIPRSSAGVNTTYRARAFSVDKIGNMRCFDLVGSGLAANGLTANANGFFGLDNEAPTLVQTAGPATNSRVFTGNTASFAFQDSISGFVLNRQIRYIAYRNFVIGDSALTSGCSKIVDGVNATQMGTGANGCAGTANSAPNITIDGNQNIESYYTIRARSVDQAGNFSTGANDITNVYLLDNTAPIVQGISIPQNLVGGTSTTFTSTATDNVDLKSSNFNLTYSATSGNGNVLTPGGATLYYSGDSYGPNYDITRVTTASVNANVPFFIQQLQGTSGGGAPLALSAADSGEAQTINVRAIDAANLISVASVAGIPNINISSAAGFTTGAEFDTFTESNTALATPLSNGTGTNGRTVTLSAAAVKTSGGAAIQSTGVPFSQVCFFYQQTVAGFAADATIPTGALVSVGCVSAPSITDVAGVSRTWTYQLAGFDPPAALGTASSVTLYAVGVKANGVGIVSQPNNTVLMVP